MESKGAKLVQGIAQRFSGLGIKEYDIEIVAQHLNLQTKKPADWTENDLSTFVKELRKRTRPMIIAANKADLCHDLSVVDKLKIHGQVIACSAETELLLRKASKSGLIEYFPGEKTFKIKDGISLNPQQQKALDLANKVLAKIGTTGVQQILNSACFDLFKLIVVYPVEDETKLSNKDGEVLPDSRLLFPGSTAKDLAQTVHADLAKGFLHAVDAKTKQRIGAQHQLKNGDVIKIVSTLSRG
jgi:ribosome-binding ATPase YchF (GTP1/OBG family)